jgi:predicted DNA-binding protein
MGEGREALTERDERVTKHQVVIRLPDELYSALYERAAEDDRPVARVIRSALRRYLFEEEGARRATI